MSETDDTDVLLLIPPNFFFAPSSESENSLLESSRTVVHKPLSCTAQALGKLFNQVNSLETRLESLELDTSTLSSVGSLRRRAWETESFDTRSLDRKYSTFPRSRRRKPFKKRSSDLSVTSFDSAVSRQKNIPLLNLKNNARNKFETANDSQSMDGDISSIVSTPSKKNDKLLLHEIDEFLNKVESYETPDTKSKSQDISPQNVIKAAGDYINQKLDSNNTSDDVRLPSGRVVHSDVLEKYIYLVRNKGTLPQPDSAPQSNVNRTETTNLPTSSNYVKDLKSPSIRRLNFSENKDVNTTSTPKRQLQTAVNYTTDAFKPSSNKIYDRATKVLEHYKSRNYSTQTSVANSDLTTLRKEEFKMPQMRPFDSDNREGIRLAAAQMDTIDTDLLSLSELWGEKGEGERAGSVKLEEERLKREHCEAMIQQLQKKILEQQERLAVAMKVDKAKDSAIARLKDAWLKLTGSLDRAEERHRAALEKMVHEVDNFKTAAGEAQKKTNHFETEVYKALDFAHDYQEKCKQLTIEKTELQNSMEKNLSDKEEIIKSKEREIEVLKENYDTIMKMNKQSTDCVISLEACLEKERLDHAKTNNRVTELCDKVQSLTDEISLGQQEKEILKEKINEERARCNLLERQLSDMQNQTSELLKKYDALDAEGKSLRSRLESERAEVRAEYQRQLERALLGEAARLERRAAARERAHADAHCRQAARLEDQHKLEVSVLEEKHKEEITLYRLQLAQATEKIELLESELSAHARRRARLAARLHAVMQAQWRQALSILTQPPRAAAAPAPAHGHAATPPPHEYSPPKGPKPPPLGHSSLDALDGSAPGLGDYNFEGLSDNELQQYIKQLLAKQANFNLEDEVTGSDPEEPTSDRPERRERADRCSKRSLNTHKPPWKA